MTDTTADPIDLSLLKWRDDPGALQATLLDRLPGGIRITADLSRPADTLTVQLLIAAREAAQARGSHFVVDCPSQAFRDGLQTLGLHDDVLG